MSTSPPAARPANPRFSSGPCTKPPGYSLQLLKDAALGRSHRSARGKARLKQAIDETRALLAMPADWRLGIVPGSDTGAVEMALWNLLGPRPVEVLVWESFGAGWAADIRDQLQLEPRVHEAPYGRLPDLSAVNFDADVVFCWNGTTSGVRLPPCWAPPDERGGLAIRDATSAAFAMELPWERLDVVTLSWQKALGGEGGHGMLALSPRAIKRLTEHEPAWPVPKLFRLTSAGKVSEGLFAGDTINTPSMLCVEDWLAALAWGRRVGGLPALIARAESNARILAGFVAERAWIENLAEDPETASCTSVCLRFTDPRIEDGAAFAKAVVRRLEQEGVGLDLGAYRDAPPGLRIWCGATVEAADLRALLPWLDWAWQAEIAALEG